MEMKEPPSIAKDDNFERILISIVNDMSASDLLSIPGIYEILSKHLKNRILQTWEEEQELKKDFDEI